MRNAHTSSNDASDDGNDVAPKVIGTAATTTASPSACRSWRLQIPRLRLARRRHSVNRLAIRFAGLLADMQFVRRSIARIDKPPPVNPSIPKPKHSPDQLNFCYN